VVNAIRSGTRDKTTTIDRFIIHETRDITLISLYDVSCYYQKQNA
jgi:hypothetical protein